MPLFESIEQAEPSDGVMNHWNVVVRSPRTCGYGLYTIANRQKGLASLLLLGFNSSAIILGVKKS